MSIQFFSSKTLGSVVVVTGTLGGGGTIYWYQMPRTWQELLTKEGFVFLSSDEDYKGMFQDQKSESIWTNESTFTGADGSNVKTKVSGYCEGKLKEELSSDTSYQETKQKLIAFCTFDGIKSVKGKLIQNKKGNWIKDSEEDKWKTLFAVYRHNHRFINWLKEDSKDSTLSSKSEVDSHWEKPKNACSKLLSKPHRELTEDKYFEYAFWWCTDLGYTTVKEKLDKDKSTWTQENDGNTIQNRWKDTSTVTSKIKTDLSKKESDTLQGKDYKQWCDDQLKKNLKENDIYKEKYEMVKSVCRKVQ